VGLALRLFGSSPAVSTVLAGITLLVALVAAGTPNAMQLLFTAGLQHTVSELPPTERDLQATEWGGPVVGPAAAAGSTGMVAASEKIWGAQNDILLGMREDMPSVLAASVDDPQFTALFDSLASPPDSYEAPGQTSNVLLGFDPWFERHVTIVEGSAPAAASTDWPGEVPLEIALSTASATAMHWSIGEARTLRTSGTANTRVTLSGTFEAVDPADEFWTQTPIALDPEAQTVGDGEPIYTAVAFANAASWPRVLDASMTPRLHAWFPLHGASLTATTSDEFLTAVRAFTRVGQPNDGGTADDFARYRNPGEPITPAPELGFLSRVITPIEAENHRATATLSVVSMAAVGPIGLMVAVLVLAIRLLLLRHRDSLAIARARGASALRLRGTLAAEGVILGTPAAVAGALVAPDYWPVAVLAGLLPAILLAFGPLASQRTRLDLGTVGRTRQLTEVVTLVLAAAGVVLLLQRGVSTDSASAFDPVLVATPLLLTLAACVLVLRAYPVPLAFIARRAHEKPGLVAFLGAAQGLRDQAAGLAPVLAMVVAVSIGVLSSVLLATTSTGIDAAARESVGADVAVHGTGLDPDAARAVGGDSAVATVYIHDEEVRGGGDSVDSAVIAADTAALVTVQRDVPNGIHRDLSEPVDGAIPVIVSQKLAEALGGETKLTIGGAHLVVVGVAGNANAFTTRDTWLIGDLAAQNELVGPGGSPKVLLIDAKPRAKLAAVQAGLEDAMAATGATVTSSTGQAAALRANPSTLGLSVALIIALVLVAVLCGFAVALTLVLGGATRAQLQSTLRALGLGRRSERQLLAWEVLPVALVALVVGEVLGLALPAVILAGVDLRRFTGGAQQPLLVLDPVAPLLVAVGFAAIVLVSLLVTTVRSNHD
jgi:putative ABC transport system permease protein